MPATASAVGGAQEAGEVAWLEVAVANGTAVGKRARRSSDGDDAHGRRRVKIEVDANDGSGAPGNGAYDELAEGTGDRLGDDAPAPASDEVDGENDGEDAAAPAAASTEDDLQGDDGDHDDDDDDGGGGGGGGGGANGGDDDDDDDGGGGDGEDGL